jgi:hypothetical protein
MVTGRPVLQPDGQPATVHHGYGSNYPEPTHTIHNAGNTNLAYVTSVFDVVHDHGLATAFYYGKSRLDIIGRSYNETNGAPDMVGEDNGQNKIDSVVLITHTPGLVGALVEQLSNAPPHYTFVHLVDLDSLGHAYGWGSLEWSNAAARVDGYLGSILSAIETSPSLAGQTAVIVSADHGGGGGHPNHHSDPVFAENYTIPFFVWGPSIPAGVNLYHLMDNRYDPGTSRPDYNYSRQPIRDGDGANLALQLLGLEPVPESSIRPELSFEPPLFLSWTRSGPHLVLHWEDPETNLVLEGKPTLQSSSWDSLSEGIEINGQTRSLTVDIHGAGAYRFYRLRAP